MKDVLVIQAARFGDLLQSRRLLKSLRRSYKVHLAADRGFQSLIEQLYPEIAFHPAIFHGDLNAAGCQYNANAFALLKRQQFELVFNCNFSPLTSALTRIFDQKQIFGYKPAHVSDGGLLASPWARLGFQAAKMRAASPLNLVDFWAWFANTPIPPSEVNPVARPGGRGMGIAVAGQEKRRSLSARALADTARTAFAILGKPEIRLFGTANEKNSARSLLRLFAPDMRAKTTDLCGQTDWSSLISEMTGLDLLLTPDTGLMHLAAFLGVPVAAFFLSSAWCHETGPYGVGHLVFQSVASCSPCLESAPCRQDLVCHKPYEDPNFQRIFGRALTGTGNLGSFPGLQVWRSGLDSFGALPSLLAGEDNSAAARADIRKILADKVKIAPTWNPVSETYKELLERFEPSSEWMLPPSRYC